MGGPAQQSGAETCKMLQMSVKSRAYKEYRGSYISEFSRFSVSEKALQLTLWVQFRHARFACSFANKNEYKFIKLQPPILARDSEQ